MRVGAHRRLGRNCVIVERDRVVTNDELYIGVFSRDDFAHSLSPDRTVHHADALHLKHQLVRGESGILTLQPVESVGRANFLDVDVWEKSLKIAVPLADISSCEGPYGVRPPSVDIAKEAAFDLVVYGCSEERRVQVCLPKGARGWRIESASFGYHAAVIKDLLRGRQIEIGKRTSA